MSINIYGIATCNSCKKALKWLEQHNYEYTWIDTRKSPPSLDSIQKWADDIGTKVMRNTSGGSYRALGEEKKTWSEQQWVSAFAKDPMLLKRPLFEREGQALFTGFRGSDDEIKAKLAFS